MTRPPSTPPGGFGGSSFRSRSRRTGGRTLRILSAILLGGASVAPAALAASWTDVSGMHERLHAGEIVVSVEVDRRGGSARAHAAIWIPAPAESVWAVLTDCAHAAEFVPGLKHCRCIAAPPRPEGCALLEREYKYAWFMPPVHDVVHVDYTWPRGIDSQRVSGDLQQESGSWRLEPYPDANATLLEYEFQVTPGFWMPGGMLERSLNENLRAALQAVRTRVQSRPATGEHLTAR